MDKYQRLEKPRPEVPIMDNEIRITSQGMPRNYIAYALNLMGEKGLSTVVLKAMGNAISKAVTVAEVIKRRIPYLNQNTAINSTPVTYTWEPLEEGLLPFETIKNVSTITIILSTAQLDTSSPGYQPPLPIDQVKPLIYAPPQVRGRGTGRPQYGRGNFNGNGIRGKARGRFGNDGQDNKYRGGGASGFGGRGRGRERARGRVGRN